MLRLIKRISRKSGLSPGSLVHIGEKKVEKVRISLIAYNEKSFEEKELDSIQEILPFMETQTVTWVNIDGLHDIDIIAEIGQNFELHPLVLEDILNTAQRPKMEDFDDYLFISFKMLTYNEREKQAEIEHVSVILGKNYVFSFQEGEGDVFEPIRERIRKSKVRIRRLGNDYLAYSLIDAVVDNYFLVMERLEDRIEDMEEFLLSDPGSDLLRDIHHIRRELIFLRKSIWPLREMISYLERGESSLIREKTTVFFRDLYDHTIQVMDTVDSLRDMTSGMQDVYLSSMSNRMNDIMRVLTVIATVFIPLTFIAGVYGMNFKFMPELEWHWGYPLIWVVMIIIGLSMLIYFKIKNWF
jgi:magnesium transporter